MDTKEIVRGLDPVDWVQMQLIAKLPPEKRIVPGLQAQAFAMAALRGTFQTRYPQLSLPEINYEGLGLSYACANGQK